MAPLGIGVRQRSAVCVCLVVGLAMCCITVNTMQQTANMLCGARLLSSFPLGLLSPSDSAVSFIKPGQTRNLFTWLRRQTNSSLCVLGVVVVGGCVCMSPVDL